MQIFRYYFVVLYAYICAGICIPNTTLSVWRSNVRMFIIQYAMNSIFVVNLRNLSQRQMMVHHPTNRLIDTFYAFCVDSVAVAVIYLICFEWKFYSFCLLIRFMFLIEKKTNTKSIRRREERKTERDRESERKCICEKLFCSSILYHTEI